MLWVVAIGFLMQTLDSTIVNTALPSIALSLGENPLRMQAVVYSYSLMMAVVIPSSGWLSDRFGTQKIFLFAICLFALSSLLCAASGNLALLVASRALQGVGGSMLLPVGRLIVLRNFPGEKFLPAISFVAIPGLVGPLLGPTLGGWLSEAFSWRWIFLINVPVGIAGAIATVIYMPNNRPESAGHFDAIGYFLLAAAMLTSSLSLGGLNMGLTHSFAAGLGISGAASLFFYFLYARSAGNPIFNLRIFKIQSFSVGLSGNLFARIGNSSMPYLIPLMVQTDMGYSPSRAGMMLLPSSIAGILAKRPATYLITHYGYRAVLVANTITVGLTMASYAFVSRGTPVWAFLALQFFFGAVNSIQFTAMNALTLKDLPEPDSGSGNSMLSMVQMLSLSISVVIASAVFDVFRNNFAVQSLAGAFHGTFAVVGLITVLSAAIFNRV
jgi:EmrB/QacA subfamily drug resistance transporter